MAVREAAGKGPRPNTGDAPPPPGLVGIVNLGNTCFMSSVLQVLLHSPILRHFFLVGAASTPAPDDPSAQASLITELDELFQEAYTSQRGVLVPVKFLAACWSAAGHLAEYSQQDAHEFYLSMLSALDTIRVTPTPPPGVSPAPPVPNAAADATDTVNAAEAANAATAAATSEPQQPARPTTLASLVFGGELQSDVTCCRCGHTSTTVDPVMDIAIDVDACAAPPPPPPPTLSPVASTADVLLSDSSASRAASPEVTALGAAGPGRRPGATRSARLQVGKDADDLAGSLKDSQTDEVLGESGSRRCTPEPVSAVASGRSGQPENSATSFAELAGSTALLDSPNSPSGQGTSQEAATSQVVLRAGGYGDEAQRAAAAADACDSTLSMRAGSAPFMAASGCALVDLQAESAVVTTGRRAASGAPGVSGRASAPSWESLAAAPAGPTMPRKRKASPFTLSNDQLPASPLAQTGAAVAAAGLPDGALTLTACLARFTQSERVGAGSWSCSACGTCAAMHKQLSVRKLPPVLCFHVKRFRLDTKLEVPLRFPTGVLDMRPFLSSATVARRRQLRGPSPEQRRLGRAGLYRLMAVVQHSGSLQGGHYVMYLRLEGRWYLCDDAQVLQVPQSMVVDAEPYMLFYTHHDL